MVVYDVIERTKDTIWKQITTGGQAEAAAKVMW